MNNVKDLSLQDPEELDNRKESISSEADTPVVNPSMNRKSPSMKITIPSWNDFTEENKEVPTIDYSPIYADTPMLCSRRSSPYKKYNMSETEETIEEKRPKSCIEKICEWLVGMPYSA